MLFNSEIHSIMISERGKNSVLSSLCWYSSLAFILYYPVVFGGFLQAHWTILFSKHALPGLVFVVFMFYSQRFPNWELYEIPAAWLWDFEHFFFSFSLLFIINLKAHLNLWSRVQFWKELVSSLTALKQLIIWVNWWTALFSSSMINRVMPWSVCPSKGFGYHKFFCS